MSASGRIMSWLTVDAIFGKIGSSELWSEQPINPPVDSSEWKSWDLGEYALKEYAFLSGSSPSLSVHSEPP